jgi:CO/xanthine dehydrogenase Mo-binding subunit
VARLGYRNGEVTLYTSTVEMGQGAHTALAQIAADVLGVPVAHIRVVGPDTAETPFDQTTVASRSTEMMGAAVRDAATKLKEQLRAAPDANKLDVTGEHATHLTLDPATAQGVAAADWHQGAGAAEVEVDRETGQIRVLRYHAAAWAGRVVNRRGAELQNLGNVIYGLGPTVMEEVLFDEARIANASLYDFRDYHIPSIRDLPRELTSESIEAAGAEPSGLGEMTLPPVAPAIAAAVEDAVGVRIFDLPLRADRLLQALRKGRT